MKELELKTCNVPLSGLKTPYARTVINAKAEKALMDSIAEYGMLDPIHVSALNNVIAGNRRTFACRTLGHAEIKAIIHPDIATDKDEVAYVLAHDTQNERNPVDTANLLMEYMRKHDLNGKDAAAHFKISEATASRLKTIYEQPPEILEALRIGKFSVSKLMELKRVPMERRVELMNEAITNGWGPKELRKATRPKKAAVKPTVEMVNVAASFGSLLIKEGYDLDEMMKELKEVIFPRIPKLKALNLGAAELAKQPVS